MLLFYLVDMTLVRLRLLTLSFLGIVAGISGNALYLQDLPQFAGSAISETTPTQSVAPSTASLPRSVARFDRGAPDDGSPSVTKRLGQKRNLEHFPDRQATVKIVRAIQRELTRKGYNPGSTDGNSSIETRAAIIAYEFDEGLPLKGEPSEDILRSLIFGAAPGATDLGQTDRFEKKKELIIQVQNILTNLGYMSQAPNGQFDIETQNAIRRFENARGLPERGRLTSRILIELVMITNMPLTIRG